MPYQHAVDRHDIFTNRKHSNEVLSAVGERRLTVAFFTPAWPLGAAANGIVSYGDSVTAGLRRLGHTPCILSIHSNNANPPSDVYWLDRQERSALARIRDG